MSFGKSVWNSLKESGRSFLERRIPRLWDSLWDTGMSYGHSFAKGAMGNYFERQSLDYQAQLNEQAALNAYNRQLDFWNKQNAYNDPSAQMARLQAAGLNPAMINANGVNNTAGGLSSVPSASPGSPNNNKPDPMQALDSLSSYAKDIKEMGFLDASTAEKLENILNLQVDRELKEIEKGMNLTKAERENLDLNAFYEALYGKSIDGGEPTIPNNEYTARINEARSNIRRSDAEAALSSAQEKLTLAQESYQRTMEDIQTEESKERQNQMRAQAEASRAQAAASYAAAYAANVQAQYYSDKNGREAEQLAMQQSVDELKKKGLLTENQANELKLKVNKAWDEGVFGSDAKGHRMQNFETIVNDFFHNNLNFSGGGTVSKAIR